MKDIKVKFGLEAQGHILTIETELKRWQLNTGRNMIHSVYVWNGIGKMIGWCPFKACLHYFKYLEKNNRYLEEVVDLKLHAPIKVEDELCDILERLRAIKSASMDIDSEERKLMNIVCDRLDVLISKIND